LALRAAGKTTRISSSYFNKKNLVFAILLASGGASIKYKSRQSDFWPAAAGFPCIQGFFDVMHSSRYDNERRM
jgi:hypothetical protein